MHGEKQRARHYNQNHRGEPDCGLVVVQHLRTLAGSRGEKALHHEDAVVHADAEDEGRNDDIYQIELQTENPHDALHDVPAEGHREESYDADGHIAERQEKHHEHENHRYQQDGVEVVVDDFHHVARVEERVYDERAVHLVNSFVHIHLLPLRH